jgi:uncharacterized membrane protein
MWLMDDQPKLTPTAKKNIRAIADVEQQLLRKRSIIERMGSAVARFFGSMPFIVAHGFLLGGWILWNTNHLRPLRPFDPYPFPFLSLLVGIEFILLTTFVLMNQKYQMRREEHWSHLHLQLSMLTEQEITKNLELLSRLCERMGLPNLSRDEELMNLSRPTPVSAIAGEIEKSREAGASEERKAVGDMEQKLLQTPEDGE